MREEAILKAVDELKASEYHATAIKVELEAQLGRGSNRYGRREGECDECHEGSNTCCECEGEYRNDCESCEGSGTYTDQQDRDHDCNDCEGTGNSYCDYCEEGYQTCGECEGDWEGAAASEPDDRPANYGNDIDCHIFIMKELKKLGLTEYRRDDPIRLSHGVTTRWHPVAPLKYAEFYRDGSVDSEFTFTLSLEDSRNVLLLPKVINIFKKLADAVGNGMDVQGAGMHMALLNDPNCLYPVNELRGNEFGNFRRGMTLLIPALYFLGTSCDTTRGMSYRRPAIGANTHRTAIDYRGGALEFRVFDTCYDNPDSILDNVVVMRNCIKFWSAEQYMPKLAKKYPRVKFGRDTTSIQDFYCTLEHFDVLDEGLRLLKPSYYTVRELKQQRKFTANRGTLKKLESSKAKEIADTYKEYENRFDANLLVQKYQQVYINLDGLAHELMSADPSSTPEQIIAQAHERAEAWVTQRSTQKQQLDGYVQQRLQDFLSSLGGQYTLDPNNTEVY